MHCSSPRAIHHELVLVASGEWEQGPSASNDIGGMETPETADIASFTAVITREHLCLQNTRKLLQRS